LAKFSIATTEGYMDKNNQWQDMTEWHNLVAWGPVAQKVERSVHRGALVLIEGKLKTRKWQDQEGNNRRATDIEVGNVVVLERADRNSGGGGGGGYQRSDSDYSDGGSNNSYRGGGGNYGGGDGHQNQGGYNNAPPVQDINEFPYDEGDGDPF
jgi:single-strand DNA-binding protein